MHGHLRLERDGLLDVVVRRGEILPGVARDGREPVRETVARRAGQDALDVVRDGVVSLQVDERLRHGPVRGHGGGVFGEPVARDARGAVPLAAADEAVEQDAVALGGGIGHGQRFPGTISRRRKARQRRLGNR